MIKRVFSGVANLRLHIQPEYYVANGILDLNNLKTEMMPF